MRERKRKFSFTFEGYFSVLSPYYNMGNILNSFSYTSDYACIYKHGKCDQPQQQTRFNLVLFVILSTQVSLVFFVFCVIR